MNLKTQRNFLAVAVIVLVVLLGVIVATGGGLSGAAGAGGGVRFDSSTGQWVISSNESQTVNPLNPGQSVVGEDTFIPGLNIHMSGADATNDVVFVADMSNIGIAYGANIRRDGKIVENVLNACSIPGGGIADVGAAAQSYKWQSKLHDYNFTFTNDKTVSKFAIGVLDWGDYLSWQAAQAPNAAGTHTIQMFGYDADGSVVAQTEYTFNTNAQPGGFNKPPAYLRPSPQFPNFTPSYTGGLEQWGLGLKRAGDACEAQLGQPGKLILTIQGTGIARVEVKFKDQRSMDPHVALWLGALEIEFEGEPECYNFLALSESNKAFDFSGTAGVEFCGGGVWSNSGAESSNNSVPTYDETCSMPVFHSSGDWLQQENLTGVGYTVEEQTGEDGILADPLAGITPPAMPDDCEENGDLDDGTVVISGPMCFTNIKDAPKNNLVLQGDPLRNDNVVYIANASGAPAKIQGAFSATNVMIYVEGDFQFDSTSASLLEPNLTNGPWHGMMLWLVGSNLTLNGASDSNWTGTIYAPNAALKINGNSNTVLKTTVIAQTIDFAGTNTTKTYCVPELNFVSIP
jgi:hypothetical protein